MGDGGPPRGMRVRWSEGRQSGHTSYVVRGPTSVDLDHEAPSRPLLVLGGRILWGLTAAVVVLARVFRGSWRSAAPDAGGVPDHWIPQTALLIGFVFGLCFPGLVLPVGSLRSARERGSELDLPTVLGQRTINLAGASSSRLLIPGRGSTLDVLVIRSGWRVLVVTSSGTSSPAWSSAPCLRRLWQDKARRGSRIAAWAWGYLTLALLSAMAFVAGALVGVAAGVL